ncbi:MAG: TonB-dependent receptor [Alistipes sp.]|nr:TonB-dependent receptor [Alistipes sp.]
MRKFWLFCTVAVLTVATMPASAFAQGGMTVKGVVVDVSGMPVVGASVTEQGTSNGTMTSPEGAFSLAVSKADAVVEISFIGYRTVAKVASSADLQRVVLEEDAQALDDVVVIGYGTASKKLVSSSISSVKMDDVDKGADIDPMKMLQGRVTGVSVVSASGTPGDSPSIMVRGVSSISGNSSPLYVVDGIPAEKYPAISSSDIESIDILKDASATAIYGSRANAGVVIITTKSGSKGRTSINVDAQIGISQVANDIRMANTDEYIRTMQAAVDNYNVQMRQAKKLYVPAERADFDWVGAISRNIAITSSSNVSISGGTDKLLFYASAGVDTQQGYIANTSFNKYTGRTKFNYKAAKWLRVNINTSIAYSRQNKAEETSTSLKVIRTAREEQPWYTAYGTRDDGSYGYLQMTQSGLCRHNPVMLINEEKWWIDKLQLQGTLSLDIMPVKGLKWTPSISGYGIFDFETKKLTEKHDARAFNTGWAAIDQQKDHSFRYVFDNVVSYENSVSRLHYSVMVGHSIEKYTYDQFGMYSDNYANDAYPSSSLGLVTSGANIYPGNVNFNSYALESYFGRIALNWDNRYIVNFSMRSDGSSRFPKNNRFGYFPAGSVAWIISNEPFMPKDTALSELKLRLSAGQTGSMAGIGNWAAMSLISADGSYNESSAYTIGTAAQNLKWEKSTKYDAGVDLGFWNDRLTASVDYYYSRTDDMLYAKPVLATTGYTTITSNIGSAENQGVELAVNGRIFTEGAFKWNLGFNMSWVRSRLLSLLDGQERIVVKSSGSNLLGGTQHVLQNGQPISTWYMYRFDGIYQRDEDVPAALYAKGVRAGDCKYYDRDGNGDIDENDRVLCGKATPDFFGGITSNMRWKGLELSIFCSFSLGNKVMAAWKGVNGGEGVEHLGIASAEVNVPGFGPTTQYFNVSRQAARGFWRGEGTSNTIPRPLLAGVHTGYTYDYNVLTSTRYLEDASYFKLKTITLAYNFPERWMKACRMQGIKVFFTVDNVFCATKYDGYDPETSYNTNPAHSNYGVDFGLSPSMRSYIFGLQVKF